MKKINKNSAISIITLAASVVSFMPGLTGSMSTLAAGPATVNLGSAGNFVILAKTGVSTTGTTSVVGDVGVSPAEATYITGFDLILPPDSAFSMSSLVSGKIYAPGYANPTPANLSTAVLDMQTAYTDAAGRAADVTELGAGNIGGMTLAPGSYKWSSGLTIPTNVTLSGSANDVWIFQIAQNLNVSSGVNIVLIGGAQANNIFWQVAGQATLETTSVFNGNILSQTAIVLNTGATLNGRALAQSAVTLDASVVTKSTSTAATPTPTPMATQTPTPTPMYTSTPTPTPMSRPTPTSVGFTSLAALNLSEGDTISAAGSADPDIYIANSWGYRRLFLNPVIFGFYGHLGGFSRVRTVSSTTRDRLVVSGLFRNCETNDPKVYGVESTGEDTGILHWINTSGEQAAQDDPNFFRKVFCINNNEFNWYSQGSVYTSVNQVPVYLRSNN